MKFKFELVSSMSDEELDMEMDLYAIWRKIHIEPYMRPIQGRWRLTDESISTIIPKEINLIYEVYRKYIKYVLFEIQKRKYPLATYHYIYSEPKPDGYRIAGGGRRLEKEPWHQGAYDEQKTVLVSYNEFKKLCKEGTLTDENCRAHYVIKREDTIYTVYDLYCFPSSFKLNVERKDFYYITYYLR